MLAKDLNIYTIIILSLFKVIIMKKKQLKTSPISVIKQGHYFFFFKNFIYTLYMDYCIAHRAMNKTVFNKIDGAYPAQSINYQYLRELLKVIDFTEDDVFVDVGCAWGRLIGYMKKNTRIKKFVGVEINEEIARFAQDVFKNDNRVEIVCGDIVNNIPIDGTVFYLFNPFNEKYLEKFLKGIEKTIKNKVRLIYLHPTCRCIIDNNDYWRLIEEKRIKPKYLGDLLLCIYEKC